MVDFAQDALRGIDNSGIEDPEYTCMWTSVQACAERCAVCAPTVCAPTRVAARASTCARTRDRHVHLPPLQPVASRSPERLKTTELTPVHCYAHMLHTAGLCACAAVHVHPTGGAEFHSVAAGLGALVCNLVVSHLRRRTCAHVRARARVRVQVHVMHLILDAQRDAALYRLYLGIADGIPIARVWACRYSR